MEYKMQKRHFTLAKRASADEEKAWHPSNWTALASSVTEVAPVVAPR